MPTLSTLKNQTVPATIAIGGGNFITLEVRVSRGTVSDKREFTDLIKQSGALVQQKGEGAVALQKRREKVLAPVQSLAKERLALLNAEGETDAQAVATLETKIEKQQEQVKAEIEEIDREIAENDSEGERLLHESMARQLVFYVASTDITTDEGEPIEPTFEFFRDEFSYKLLESSLEAISTTISGPLAIPGSTED